MKIPYLAAPAAGLVLSMTCMSAVHAAFVLTIDDLSTTGMDAIISDGQGIGFTTGSGLVTTVADAGIEDGAITFNGGVGNFTVNVVTGISDPLIGPGRLDLNSVNVSGGTGELLISLTDTDYTGPVPAYRMDAGGTTDGVATITGDYVADNIEFGAGTQIGAIAAGGIPFDYSITRQVPSSPTYSLVIDARIFHRGAGEITSFDAVLTPIPIPAAVWLFGSGLLGMVGIARRKKAV
jgi:hypothetical protein